MLKYIVLVVLSFSFFFPLYWMAISALKDDPQVYTIPPILIPNPAHWDNFVNAWTTTFDFNQMAINSIFRYCLPVTLATVLMSTVVAYGFSRVKWKGRDTLLHGTENEWLGQVGFADECVAGLAHWHRALGHV